MRGATIVAAVCLLTLVRADARLGGDGRLSISSDPPGAALYVDGLFRGQTPLSLPALPAGDHRVRLVQPGYLDNSRLVRIGADKTETLHVRLTARVVQAAGMKIVVVAGEDAVNIIQQNTAVTPIVEVRDRNDLPVTGVAVTFTISGQNAVFGGGLQTVTVTTNAAGRAAVSSLNPLTSGAYQINVSAGAQGQTVTATISQTNFMTAAAAAQAGAIASSGAAAAAGSGGASAAGGLSGLALTGILAGAGAGTLVGVRAARGSDPEPCQFLVGDGSTTFMVPSFAAGQQFSVESKPRDCQPHTWTATSNAAFISVTSDANTAFLNFETNPRGSPPRTGTVTIAGQVITIIQNASCVLAVSPLSINFPAAGGIALVNLTLSPSGCDRGEWTASAPLVTVSPTSGIGSGTVTVTLGSNPNLFSRGATLFVGGASGSFMIPITQAGAMGSR